MTNVVRDTQIMFVWLAREQCYGVGVFVLIFANDL